MSIRQCLLEVAQQGIFKESVINDLFLNCWVKLHQMNLDQLPGMKKIQIPFER